MKKPSFDITESIKVKKNFIETENIKIKPEEAKKAVLRLSHSYYIKSSLLTKNE